MKFPRSLTVSALLLSLSAAALSSQTVLRDPMIPNGETAVYTVRDGDEQYSYSESVAVIEDNRRDIYRFKYSSEKETVEVKVERSTMLPFSIHSVALGNGISIDSSTRLSLERHYPAEGVPVLSFTDLKYVLRGYPFGELSEDVAIVLINTRATKEDESSDFAVSIRYLEIEQLRIGDRTVACHKVELRVSGSGIMRVLRPFIPRTYFWFSVEQPHYLVAYEGSSSFPGSPKRYVELRDYSGWN